MIAHLQKALKSGETFTLHIEVKGGVQAFVSAELYKVDHMGLVIDHGGDTYYLPWTGIVSVKLEWV